VGILAKLLCRSYNDSTDYVFFERSTGMNANLVLFKNNGATKKFALPGTVTVVGRRQECDLCVPLMVVSRKHCEINQDQGLLRVRDLGSRNGTFVNGEKVAETVLNPGDRLQIGPVAFAVQIDGEPAEIVASDSAILHPPADVPTANMCLRGWTRSTLSKTMTLWK
jgi:pSer/pThr/pTyr-binding forkhead associated (FHA) protein